MILAAPSESVSGVREDIGHAEVVRVGTKFPNIARRYFEEMGRQAEIIELHGSIELAPLVGGGTALLLHLDRLRVHERSWQRRGNALSSRL